MNGYFGITLGDETSFKVSVNADSKPGYRAKKQELVKIVEAAGLSPNRNWRHPLRTGYSGLGIEANINLESYPVSDASGKVIRNAEDTYVEMDVKGHKDNDALKAVIELVQKWYDVHNAENYVSRRMSELGRERHTAQQAESMVLRKEVLL